MGDPDGGILSRWAAGIELKVQETVAALNQAGVNFNRVGNWCGEY